MPYTLTLVTKKKKKKSRNHTPEFSGCYKHKIIFTEIKQAGAGWAGERQSYSS